MVAPRNQMKNRILENNTACMLATSYWSVDDISTDVAEVSMDTSWIQVGHSEDKKEINPRNSGLSSMDLATTAGKKVAVQSTVYYGMMKVNN